MVNFFVVRRTRNEWERHVESNRKFIEKRWGEEELLWEEEVQEVNACGIRTYRRGTWATLPFGLSPTQMRQPNN